MPVTRLGWTVVALTAASGGLGWWFGWRELVVASGVGALVLGLSALYLVGARAGEIQLQPEPSRLRAGDPAGHCLLTVVAPRGHHVPPNRIEVPIRVGGAAAPPYPVDVARVPAGGRSAPLALPVPADRRGVVVVGPASVVRADPFGLLRRVLARSAGIEVYVHPQTVRVEPTGAGLLRDLEGRASRTLSASDVAFYALRDYVPGDDLRHVHPLTSARVRRLVVRQFVDTRTAHLTIIVSGAPAEYGDVDEFEVALSAGGSLALRAVDDGQRVSVVAAGPTVATHSRRSRPLVLDGLSRAELGAPDSSLVRLASHARQAVPATSLVLLVAGTPLTIAQLGRAAVRFGPDVRVVGLRVAPADPPAARRAGQLALVTISSLADLRSALRAAVQE